MSPKAGKTIKRRHLADYLVAGAGLLAIVIGIVAIVDVINCVQYYAYVDTDTYEFRQKSLPMPLHNRSSNIVPLILFGAATSMAWFCSARAVFRMNSIEANSLVSSVHGVRQRDLSYMLELRAPTWAWLRWRCRLWRSSLFAIFIFALYVAVALSYRVAFGSAPWLYSRPSFSNEVPRIGCLKFSATKSATLSKFVEFMDPLGSVQPRVLMQDDVIRDKWQISRLWFSGSRYNSEHYRSHNLTGYFLADVRQKVTPAPEVNTQVSTWINLEEHPQCGKMLRIRDSEMGWQWIGIYSQYLTLTSSPGTAESAGDSITDDALRNSGQDDKLVLDIDCPIRLNESVYDAVLQSSDLLASRHEVLSFLLAQLHADPQQIIETQRLRDQGLLGATDDSCRRDATYELRVWYQAPIGLWPSYQYLAASLLIVWGLTLVGSSFGFATFLLQGCLDQYMAFGADLGEQETVGASSGLRGAKSETRWRFVIRNQDGGAVRMRLVKADGFQSSERRREEKVVPKRGKATALFHDL